MKKYFVDFGVGLILGIAYFWGLILLGIDWLGVTTLIEKSSLDNTTRYLTFALFSTLLSMVPFVFYLLSPLYKKFYSPKSILTIFYSLILFAFGFIIPYIIFMIVAIDSLKDASFIL